MVVIQKVIKPTIKAAFAILLLFGVVFAYFMYLSPRSGAVAKGKRLERMVNSPNYSEGEFQNTVPTTVGGRGVGAMLGAGYSWLFGGAARVPQNALPVGLSNFTLENDTGVSSVSVTWFGHSTVLVSFAGKNILFDPMFSESSAPVPYLSRRFSLANEFDVNSLPELTAVVISHDHYDHLDLESVQALAAKTSRFFAPLGVGAHLESWGVAPTKIVELDWWDSFEFTDLTFSATPARHYSGRRIPGANPTLWASWVISNNSADTTIMNIFFSGDSGYFPGFKEIGERFGPFDFCMVECGQYSENWPDIHMTPEETVRAFLDLDGELLMPIHWSAFDLSLHAWDDPPRRMSLAAEKENIRLALPLIGQTFSIDNPPQERWWEVVD